MAYLPIPVFSGLSAEFSDTGFSIRTALLKNSFLPACRQWIAVCEAPPSSDFWDRFLPQRKGEQKRFSTVRIFGAL